MSEIVRDRTIERSGMPPTSDNSRKAGRQTLASLAVRARTFTRGGRLLAFVLLVLMALLIAPPLIYVIWQSFQPRAGYSDTSIWAAYSNIWHSARLGRAARGTLEYGFGSTAFAVVVGGSLAWLVARTDAAFKRLAYVTALLGLAMPGLVTVLGWIFLFGPGAVGTKFCDDHVGGICFNVESLRGMILVEGLTWVPLIFLLAVGPLQAFDASLEDAAYVSGSSRFAAIRYVTGPLLWPVLASVGLLMVIRAFQSFEVPLFLGVPAKVHVFTSDIYQLTSQGLLVDYSTTAAYGVMLVICLSLLLMLHRRIARGADKYAVIGGKPTPSNPIKLGKARPIVAVLQLLLFLLYLLPVLFIALESFQTNIGRFGSLTLKNYRSLFSYPEFGTALKDTILVAICVATAAVILGTLISWVSIRRRGFMSSTVTQLAALPLAVPSIVLGLAFLILLLHAPLPLYGRITGTMVALLAFSVPYAVRYIEPGVIGVKRELEEAGRVSGMANSRVLWHIVLPLVASAVRAGWSYVLFLCFKELPVVALIVTAASPMLVTMLLELYINGSLNIVAALGTLIAAIGIAIALLTWRATSARGADAFGIR